MTTTGDENKFYIRFFINLLFEGSPDYQSLQKHDVHDWLEVLGLPYHILNELLDALSK